MIGVFVQAEGLDMLLNWLYQFEHINFQPLAEQVKEILIRGNEKARLAGIGADGIALAPIKPQTVKRRARAGKGSGPPLSPDESASRTFFLQADIITVSPDHVIVQGSWPQAQLWLKYHSYGVPIHNLPPRMIVGISPDMYAEIQKAFDQFLLGLISFNG